MPKRCAIAGCFSEGASNGDRRTASRARHPRRLPAARSEPEDRDAARAFVRERNNEGSVYFDAGTIVAATMKSNPHLLGTDPRAARARRPLPTWRGRRRCSARATSAASARSSSRTASSRRATSTASCGSQIETVVFDLMSWSEGFFSFTEEPPRPIRKDIAFASAPSRC